MIDSVFSAALKPVSARDRDFLQAMSKDLKDSKVSGIKKRMGVTQSYAQKYRTRLIEAKVIAPTKRGELTFVIPYLGEYLRGEF
jgi:hypothetical protein